MLTRPSPGRIPRMRAAIVSALERFTPKCWRMTAHSPGRYSDSRNSPSPEERALMLYRRYIALEQSDPWGPMAEGDVLARMGRWEEALLAYGGAAAIAPGERDVAIGRARILDRAGRPNEAAAGLAAWIRDHPDDGEAWDLLGRSRMRAGRPQAASAAFENAARRNIPVRLHGSRWLNHRLRQRSRLTLRRPAIRMAIGPAG
jgi:predicted Zn-dependent protease